MFLIPRLVHLIVAVPSPVRPPSCARRPLGPNLADYLKIGRLTVAGIGSYQEHASTAPRRPSLHRSELLAMVTDIFGLYVDCLPVRWILRPSRFQPREVR
jgi:hypothetical protein